MDLEAKEELVSWSHLGNKTTHFSQLSSLQDHSLNQLRDHIKQVMIPMLIKTFQCQLEVLPEEKEGKKRAFQETYEQLKQLDRDLHILEQWVQNCRLQMQKALSSTSFEEACDEEVRAIKPLQERLSSPAPVASVCKTTPWWKGLFLRKTP